MILRFSALLCVLWCGFFWVWRTFPYIRPGAVIVTEAKRGALPFPEAVPQSRRLVVFGNSKVLTGFLPEEFDRASGGRFYSWNGGLPGETHFLGEMERLIRMRQVPGHVLLTVPPAEEAASDEQIMDEVFPFRRLFRDSLVFCGMSVSRGGPRELYRFGEESARRVGLDRGYYFMASHSRYHGNRLPAGLVLPSDRPGWANGERAGFGGTQELERWRALSRKYGFRLYLAPRYYRTHEFGAAPGGQGIAGIPALGPEYFRYENKYFSDPVHLNREGAKVYTRQVAELFAGL